MPVEADLNVEDGTGFDDANAYVDFAFVDAYHDLRGNEAWADASEAEKVSAIVNATDYVDRRFTFIGTKTYEDQALAWPRDGVFDRDGIEYADVVPIAVQQATAEYALRALSAPLLPDPSVDETGGAITLRRERVGPIEEETRFSDDLPRRVLQPYPSADRILTSSGLVLSGAGRVVRA